MKNKSRSRLYKKLIYVSSVVFLAGLVTALTGLLKIYKTVESSGFKQTNSSTVSNTHISPVAKIGAIVASVGFYAGIVFVVLLLVSKSKEK